MSFDGPVLAWLILALLPIALPIVVAVIIQHFFHVQAGCLPLVILLVTGLAVAFGITLYLDSGGEVVKGQILGKHESLVYHVDGSWNRKLTATVSYSASPGGPATVKTLDLIPARFDELHTDDFVQVNCPAKPGVFQIVRLDDQSTLSQVWVWLTDEPFLFFFVLGLLLVLGVRFMLDANLPRLFFLGTFVTVGAWWIANVGVPVWEQSNLLFGSLNSYNASVREIHPPYLGKGMRGWFSTHIFTPTDLIVLNIIPVGQDEPIMTVDQVDLGSSKLRPGQSVSVEYSAANPRVSLVPDASRTYVWKNGLLNTFLALLALFAISRLGFLFRDQVENGSFGKGKSSDDVVAS